MSNTNGSGNGAGYGPKRLEKLLAEHREIVRAIEIVLGLVAADATTSATARASTTITNALALDAARRAANGNGHEGKGKRRGRPPKRAAVAPKKYYTSAAKKRRAKTLAYLEQFSTETPLPSAAIKGGNRGLGPLVRRGYLINGSDGFLRTEKPFTV